MKKIRFNCGKNYEGKVFCILSMLPALLLLVNKYRIEIYFTWLLWHFYITFKKDNKNFII